MHTPRFRTAAGAAAALVVGVVDRIDELLVDVLLLVAVLAERAAGARRRRRGRHAELDLVAVGPPIAVGRPWYADLDPELDGAVRRARELGRLSNVDVRVEALPGGPT